MDNFFRNKIRFQVASPRKVKDLVVIPFTQPKEIFKQTGFKFLSPEFKNFLKKIGNKFEAIEAEVIRSPWGSIFLVKYDKDLNVRRFRLLARKIFKSLKEKRVHSFAFYLDDLPSIKIIQSQVELEKQGWEIEYRNQTVSLAKLTEILATNFLLADFDFSRYYKKSPKEGWPEIKEITLFGRKNLQDAVKQGLLVAEETNRARFLSNLPGGDLTPAKFVQMTRDVASEANLQIKVLGQSELKKLKAGGILGVSRGSKEKPYLVVLEYHHADLRGKKRGLTRKVDLNNFQTVFIGKGVTFDTGGLHIKHSEGMSEMHMDMSGAASVLAATSLIAKLKLPVDLTTVIPVVENMISGESYRPGDILRTISGKTIEVGSPDAEGRIIVAEAIDYVKKFYQPDLIMELSTLTGASLVALGTKASAMFTAEEKLTPLLMSAAEISGDYIWPLPLWDEYKEDIKASFADIWNIGKSRYGGAAHGAMFLWEFAKPTPFVHFDIAPRMTANSEEHLAKGSAGFGVSLLKEAAEHRSDLAALVKHSQDAAGKK